MVLVITALFGYDFVDVYIDVPDTIDISHMRSKGLQPGEELLPEGGMLYLSVFLCPLFSLLMPNLLSLLQLCS